MYEHTHIFEDLVLKYYVCCQVKTMRSLGKSKKPLVQRHPKVFAAPASAKKTPSKLAAPLPGDICKYMYMYACTYLYSYL